MNPALFVCLAFFLSKPGGGKVPWVPEMVDQLVKSRVSQQLEARRPGLKVFFDQNENCQEKATYAYTSESFVLEGEGALFHGRVEKSLSDILDGRQMDLSQALPQAPDRESTQLLAAAAEAREPQASKSSGRFWNWTTATLAGLGLGALGFLVLRNAGGSGAPYVVH